MQLTTGRKASQVRVYLSFRDYKICVGNFIKIKMEFKVKAESASLLEKMFAANSKSGVVSRDVVPNLLKEFNSDIDVTPDEFGSHVADISSVVTEGLDFANFEKVMIHYLVKQSRKESNEFGHKQVISLADFDTP